MAKNIGTENTATRRVFNACLLGSALASGTPLVKAANATVLVSPNEIAYLMADRAERSADLSVKRDGVSDVKRFWVEQWRNPVQLFEWKVSVSEPGDYEVTMMVSAPPGTRIAVHGPAGNSVFETTWIDGVNRSYNWDRITLSTPLSLRVGKNLVQVKLERAVKGEVGAALKSLELLNVKSRPATDARIRAFRSDAAWLGKAKFGFMCQCGEWAYPKHGPHKHLPQMVDRFDVTRFAEMVAGTGAGYVVWSATWATYFFPAPIKAIDRIMPERTSKRDLIGEIADALNERHMRLILYYHAGHDTTPENGLWWSKNWVTQDDKTLFFNNWCSIITEVGERYADRLAGWMFDDDLLYYPAPYERLGKAAKAGSKSRIISFNPWIQARGTDFQDFQFGEGFMGDDRLPVNGNGIWREGPLRGLKAHGCFQVDEPDWGIQKADTEIKGPRFTKEKAIQIAMDAALRNEALSWNLLMYDDGSVSEASLELLRAVGHSVRAAYPKKAGQS